MVTNSQAYSKDMLDQAKAIVEARANSRSSKTTVTTDEAYKDAKANASKMKAGPQPKKAPAAKKATSPEAEKDA